jgi:hypothetical protein
MNPRIYSDFNGPYQPTYMLLHYQGTSLDLTKFGLTLEVGMKVTVYSDSDEDEDLKADGIVVYGVIPDSEQSSCWYVDTTGSDIRYMKTKKPEQTGIL